MDPEKVFILLSLAFWLGHYIGRNNRIPEPTISSSPRAPLNSEFNWRVLEDQQLVRDESEDGSRRSSGHTMQSEPDTRDARQTCAARFSGGELVFENEEVAARRNAADTNRWRQELRGVLG